MGNGIMLKCCENISKENQIADILVDNSTNNNNKDNNTISKEIKNNLNEDNNIQSKDNENTKLKSTKSNENNEPAQSHVKFMTEFPKFPSKKKNIFFETKNKLKELNETLIEKNQLFETLQDKEKKKIKFKESQSSIDFNNKKNKNEKIILIYGSKESGKTSFVMRYLDNKFDTSYIPSLNDEKTIKNCILNKEKQFNLEFNVSNNISEIKDADCYFIFYDISSQNSFDFAKNVINEVVNVNDNKIFLIGNKKDLNNVINEKDVNDLCDKYKTEHFLISVKDNIGISNMMEKLGEIFDNNV